MLLSTLFDDILGWHRIVIAEVWLQYDVLQNATKYEFCSSRLHYYVIVSVFYIFSLFNQ